MICRIRPIAIEVIADEKNLTVLLKHGGTLRLPLRLFPKLWVATPEQRRDVHISAAGTALRWDHLDEDISVSALMRDAARRHRDERLNSQVPADFPKDTTPALLSGTQPKLAGRWIDGRLIVGLRFPRYFVFQ